jgi:hypothetical protein
MDPLNIPTEITALADTCPLYLKPPTVPTVLAHFWPAIEAHLREQIAQEVATRLGEIRDDPSTAERYHDGLRYVMRNIHRLATT